MTLRNVQSDQTDGTFGRVIYLVYPDMLINLSGLVRYASSLKHLRCGGSILVPSSFPGKRLRDLSQLVLGHEGNLASQRKSHEEENFLGMIWTHKWIIVLLTSHQRFLILTLVDSLLEEAGYECTQARQDNFLWLLGCFACPTPYRFLSVSYNSILITDLTISWKIIIFLNLLVSQLKWRRSRNKS